MRGIAARFLSSTLLLLAIFVASRALVRALPGDPLETLIAESGTTLPAETIRAELGLDQSFLPALVADLGKFSRGDLGVSLFSKQPVSELLSRRLAASAMLAGLALALALAIAVPLGVLAAARAGGWADSFCTLHGLLMAATPGPWIGPVLILILAIWIPLFEMEGNPALPAVTLALTLSGLWARLIRERVRDALAQGAACAARARGIPESKVLLKYGLAPVSGALLAYLGTQMGTLLAGAVVTEAVFNWPGIGTLMIESVLRRDYPVIEATTFVAATCCLLGTWSGDALQRWVDPRESRREWR